jgi:hypothetical protein
MSPSAAALRLAEERARHAEARALAAEERARIAELRARVLATGLRHVMAKWKWTERRMRRWLT